MKKLLLLVAIITAINTKAQTTTPTNEDCRTKITSTSTQLTITNKSMCNEQYRIEMDNQPDVITTSILANGGSLCVNYPFVCGTVKVTPVTACTCTCTSTYVQITKTCAVLAQRSELKLISTTTDSIKISLKVFQEGVKAVDFNLGNKTTTVKTQNLIAGKEYYFTIKR